MPSTLEKNVWKQLDYLTKWTITSSKHKYFKFCRRLGLHIWSGFIDDFHCLGKNNDRALITFSRRKDYKQVLQGKKDLNDLNTDDLDLPSGKKSFLNQSQCISYYILWSKSNLLHSMEIINNCFFISGGVVKVTITETIRPLAIIHLSDFTVHFPNADL